MYHIHTTVSTDEEGLEFEAPARRDGDAEIPIVEPFEEEWTITSAIRARALFELARR